MEEVILESATEDKISHAISITKDIESYINNIEQDEKLFYISPEKTGRVDMQIDNRSYYYSLGVSLFKLFTNNFPFKHEDSMQLIYSHIAVAPPKLHTVDNTLPLMLSKIIDKLLSKNPDDRYQSKEGIIHDLQMVLDNPNKQFILGTKDFIKNLKLPNKLYGRQKQVETLKNLLIGDEKNIILVEGHSGIGKSSLIEKVKEKIDNQEIYFTQTKFEQQKNIQTFNAILDALNQYINFMLLKSEEQIKYFKKLLLEGIGDNIELIKEFVPKLNTIIPQKFKLDKLHPNEAQNRFNITFKKFLNIITNFDHKIVIFIDDMQWSDLSSIKMIETIINDNSITNISIILSYRDNEVKKTHPFSFFLEEIKNDSKCQIISLKPLNTEDITLLLDDIFMTRTKEVKSLAEILKDKTEGNPFFVKELLYNLLEEQLLFFDTKKLKWNWDIEKIKNINISDNLLDIVFKKIKNSPKEIKEILKYGSIYANEFKLKEISAILNKDVNSLEDILNKHKHLNFVIKSNDTSYKFAHDRIQEAFTNYIDEDEKKQFHLKAGEFLLNNSKDIFKITDHFNRAKQLFDSEEKKNELIELNHKCALAAFKSNSYSNAIYYLLEAISLQTKNRWSKDYDRSIVFNALLTELYYLNLEFDKAQKIFKETLKKAIKVEDKIKIIQIEIFSLIAQNKMKEALDLGLDILEELNIQMPKSDDLSEYYPKLFQLYDINKISNLAKLPKMEDKQKLHIIDILNSIMAPAYLTAPHIYPKICYVAIELCIKHGNSASATNVYAVHALLLSAFFNEFKQSYEFSKLAQKLIEMYNGKAYTTKVNMIANACVIHWNDNINKTLKPLEETSLIGLETGDFEYACYSSMYYCLYSLLSGKQLKLLKKEFLKQTTLMNSLKQSYQVIYTSVWQEFLENLTLEKKDPLTLEGEFFSEKRQLNSLIQANSFSILYNLYLSKTMLAFFYEEFEKAYEYINEAKKYHIGVASLYQFSELFFYEAIISYCRYKNKTETNKSVILETLKNAIEYYELLCKTSKENNFHKKVLLEALYGDIEGNNLSWKNIKNATNEASNNGFIYHEAIGNQLGFYYWMAQEDEDYASYHLKKACQSYEKWGAVEIKNHYIRKYQETLSIHCINEETTNSFDLNTVIKASHAMAKELNTNELLKKMLNILLENSASQNGYLFLKEDNSLNFVAGYKNGKFITKVKNTKEIPLHLVNYVKRVKEDIIYSSNEKNDLISADIYIKNTAPKSIFCTPINYHGKLKGVLYLENKDILNLYSKLKVDLLRLLSNQAIVSIEQLKLFEQTNKLNTILEEQVVLRTEELNEQKEILEKLFYDSSDGSLLIKDGKLIDCNNALLKILGYKDKQEILGLHPAQLSPTYQADGKKSIDKANEIINTCLKEGSHRFDWIHKKADGENFWTDVSLTSITMAGERVIHSLWRDITKQKELEESLVEAKDNAESATRQKSEFLANMSHEIRTPMNGIIGMTHLALHNNPTPKQKNYLEKIDGSAKSLLGLINDILDFSKIEAGKLSIEKTNFDLFKVIDTVIGLVEFKAHEKNLELIVSYGIDIGKNFYGDSLRLSQILTNLINNAVKFTHEGEVGLYINKISDNKFRFEVRDSGIGIDRNIQEQLFNSFSQADGSTTRKYGGTGLGLSISKQLVELMNGKIWLESEVGKGSSFYFEIELEQKNELVKKYNLFNDRKILVVDDNKTWQEILYTLLKSFGIDVEMVSSGKVAIEKVAQHNKFYDLILMDWNMPELDGIETTKLIKEKCSSDTPPTVIMVSAFRQESIVKFAKEVGINIFLQKPINPSILNDILSALFLDDIKINYTDKFNPREKISKLSKLNNKKILLAEDNNVNQEIILGLLEGSGITIDVVNNGKEALEAYDSTTYDLILMDIQMPVMDGYEATKILREKDKKLPIVALTAHAMKEDMEKTKAFGMNEHLKKPIDVERLYEVLNQFLSDEKTKIEQEKSHTVVYDDMPILDDLNFINIDVKKGLNHTDNNQSLYIKILDNFKQRYEAIDFKAFVYEDLKREVHSLKGLAEYIGATKLHQYTLDLEDKRCKAELSNLENELKIILEEISSQLNKIEKKEEKDDSLSNISSEKKQELYDTLKEAAKAQIPKKCKDILKEFENYKLNKEEKKYYEKSKELISKYQFEELLELLDKGLIK